MHDSLVRNLDEAAEVLVDDTAARLATGTLPKVIPVAGGPEDNDLIIQVVDARGRVVAASENYVSRPPVVSQMPDEGRLHMTTRLPLDPEEDFRVNGRWAPSAIGGRWQCWSPESSSR